MAAPRARRRRCTACDDLVDTLYTIYQPLDGKPQRRNLCRQCYEWAVRYPFSLANEMPV